MIYSNLLCEEKLTIKTMKELELEDRQNSEQPIRIHLTQKLFHAAQEKLFKFDRHL